MISNKNSAANKSDKQFAQIHDKIYYPSFLQVNCIFRFCFYCSAEQGHTKNCLKSEESSYIEAIVYKHDPPRIEGVMLEDSKCMACTVSKQPSSSINRVKICEKDLGSYSMSIEPQVSHVAYCLDMC